MKAHYRLLKLKFAMNDLHCDFLYLTAIDLFIDFTFQLTIHGFITIQIKLYCYIGRTVSKSLNYD